MLYDHKNRLTKANLINTNTMPLFCHGRQYMGLDARKPVFEGGGGAKNKSLDQASHIRAS